MWSPSSTWSSWSPPSPWLPQSPWSWYLDRAKQGVGHAKHNLVYFSVSIRKFYDIMYLSLETVPISYKWWQMPLSWHLLTQLSGIFITTCDVPREKKSQWLELLTNITLKGTAENYACFFMFQTIPFGLIFGEVNFPAFLGSNSVQISILGVKYPTTTDRTLPTTRHPDPDLLVVCASSWSRAPQVLWEILGRFLRLWCTSEAHF